MSAAIVRHRRSVLVVAAVVHALFVVSVLFDSGADRNTDFNRFWEIASTPGRPYLDYQVERAPGEVAVLTAVAKATRERVPFGYGLVWLNAAADAMIVAALAWEWGVAAAVFYAFCIAPLLELFYGRIDLWSIAAATVAIAYGRRGHRIGGAVILAVGAAFKLWPIVLAPLLWPRRTAERRVGAGAALGAAVVVMAIVAVALLRVGWSGFYQVLTFRGAQGWQIEGVVGSVLEFFGSPSRLEAGAYRTGSSAPWMSLAMFAAAAPISVWAAWRGGRRESVGQAWLAAVGTLLLFSPLLSAQFIGWLIPAGAIAFAEGDGVAAVLVAAMVVLTTVFYRFCYGFVIDGARFAVLLVVARNLVLAAAVAGALDALRREARVGAPVVDAS